MVLSQIAKNGYLQVDIEYITRCVIYILNTHGTRIITTNDLHVPMMKLRELIKYHVSRYSRVIGTNIATCQYLHSKLLEQKEWADNRRGELVPLTAPVTTTTIQSTTKSNTNSSTIPSTN